MSVPTLKVAGGAVGGFVLANLITNKLIDPKNNIKLPDSLKTGWGLILLKAAIGLGLGWVGRKYARGGTLGGLGEGLGIGALTSAGLDAYAKINTKPAGAGTAGLGDFGIDATYQLPANAGGELAGVMVQDPATGEWMEVVEA